MGLKGYMYSTLQLHTHVHVFACNERGAREGGGRVRMHVKAHTKK